MMTHQRSTPDGTRLSWQEARLLVLIQQGQGKIVALDDLCQGLWGDDVIKWEGLGAAVYHLRRKMGMAGGAIVNEKGVGYRWDVTFAARYGWPAVCPLCAQHVRNAHDQP